MGRACNRHGSRMHTQFWTGTLMESHFEDQGTDGRPLLKLILRNGLGGLSTIHMAHSRDQQS